MVQTLDLQLWVHTLHLVDWAYKFHYARPNSELARFT